MQHVNGSHSNVCFFGAVSDGKSHCCTAEWINADSFIGFVKYLKKLYRKLVLVVDRANHHLKSNKVKKFVKGCGGSLILWELPKRLPELNPMEEGWKSSRTNVTYKLFESKDKMAQAVKNHIRREFKVDLFRFWS